jgi:hypothetical protein
VRFRLTSDGSVSAPGPILDDIRGTCSTGVRPPVFTEDFADGSHGFTLATGWTVSSGALRNAYDNNSLDYATAPTFDCSDEVYAPQITFDLGGLTESFFDDVLVQTSIDGGSTWVTRASYDGVFDGSPAPLRPRHQRGKRTSMTTRPRAGT